MKRWIVWIFLALVLGLTAWGLWRNPGEAVRSVYGVEVVRKTFVREVSGDGELTGEVLRLGFPASGRVVEVRVSVGDRVPAGAVLARLEDRDVRERIRGGRRDLDAARVELVRLEARFREQQAALQARIAQAARRTELLDELVRIGAASRTELEDAEQELRNLELQRATLRSGYAADRRAAENRIRALEDALRDLERQLQETRLVAPYDGVVVEVPFHPGEVASRPLRFLRAGTLVPEARFSQSDGVEISPGQDARIELEVRPDEALASRVVRVLPPEAAGGVVQVPVRFAPLDEAAGEPGYSLSAYVTVRRIEDALTVPIEALINEGGSVYVWRVHDGKAERREVRVLDRNLLEAAVEGLDPGDTVVTLPPEDLQAGEPLAVILEEPRE